MRKYQGAGTITFPKMPTINGNFELFSEDGKTFLQLTTSDTAALKLSNMPLVSGTFSGTSTNPQKQITINTVYLDKLHIDFGNPFEAKLEFIIISAAKIVYQTPKNADTVEVKRGLSNLIFYGTELIKHGDSFVRGKTTITVARHDVSLVQLPDFTDIERKLKESEGVKITCELCIQDSYDRLTAIEEICENIQTLCSLASGNYVVPLYEEIYCNGTLCETYLYPSKTYQFSKSPSLIDTSLHGSQEFKTFLETVYLNCVNFRDNMGLTYFIEFFTTSKIYHPTEVKYLLSTTAFECLEDYFAKWQTLPKIKGNLKEKMKRMWGNFSFQYTTAELDSYRDSRNSIVHEGRFIAGTDGFLKTMELRNLIERFILFILGYSGKPYYNVLKRTKEPLP